MVQQRVSKQNSNSKKQDASQNKSSGYQETPEIAPDMNIDNLTPDNIIHLQRTFGNAYVVKMLQRKQSTAINPSATVSTDNSIQRAGGTRSIHDQEHTVDDPGVNDLVGTVGDFVGTNPTEGLSIMGGDNGTGNSLTGAGSSDAVSTGASVVSILTGLVGTGMGTYNLVQNARAHKQAKEALKQHKANYKGTDTVPGDTELFATVELLKRKKSDAIKGEWENAGNIVGGISGLVNGISGLIAGATAALVAGVAFGVGAGLNAIVGTISAIRDFVSAGKRAKTQKEIGRVRAAYAELYGGLGTKAGAMKNLNTSRQGMLDKLTEENVELLEQVDTKSDSIVAANTELDEKRQQVEEEESIPKRQTLIADIMLLKSKIDRESQERLALVEEANKKEQEAQRVGQLIADSANEIADTEQKYEEYGKMITALTTAERKQGYGGKIGTGIVNLVGAAGGAALLAATLGAAAAAGPVGWILSGIALVGVIGYAVGMHIKRKIRESNVKRMKQEISLVASYIATGRLPAGGTLPDGYTAGADENARKGDMWHRVMFPTDEKKGWFNKLISKKRSGKMTMQERVDLITNYLGKYDKEAQGDVIAAGFIKALAPGTDGDQEVQNPAYSDDLPDNLKTTTPKMVALRDLNVGLLAHFFKGKAGDMQEALLSTDPDKSGDAKALLKKKLKLGD